MQKIYLSFLLLVLSVGILDAQTLYDFENLALGDLNGQDGWVTTQYPNPASGDMQIMANGGPYYNSKVFCYYLSGPGSGIDASRALPAGLFSSLIDTYKISFQLAAAYWGNDVGIGFDANMDGKITKSNSNEFALIYSTSTDYIRIRIPTGQIIEIPSTHSANWVTIDMTISDLSTGGKLTIIEHNMSTLISRILVSNVDLGVTGNADRTNPANWNMIYTHIEGSTGMIDNFKIDKNPASLEVHVSGFPNACQGEIIPLTANALVYDGSFIKSNNTSTPIPDLDPNGVTSAISVPYSTANASEITSVTINSILHTYDSDLKLILYAPDGSWNVLAAYEGDDGHNYTNTIFTSTAIVPITGATAPFTGEYLPASSFSNLTGSAQGTWYLKASDNGNGDVGSIESWTINLPIHNEISNYAWSTGESGADLAQIDYLPLISSPVTVTVTDVTGNMVTDQIDITVFPNPSLSLIGNSEVCLGQNATMTADATAFGLVGDGSISILNDNTYVIPDDHFAGVNPQILVENSSAMASELISVTINSITHTNVSDLSLFLTAPDGSWVTLSENIGGSGDNYTETEFTAYAPNFAQYGTAPFTGQFLPADMFATFTGSAQGTWKLKIVDNSPGVTGALYGWTLKLPNYNSIVNYTWNVGPEWNGLSEISFPPLYSAVYSVYVEDVNGCGNSDELVVMINPLPTVEITGENSVCVGTATDLTAIASSDQTIPYILSKTNATQLAIPDNNLSGVLSPITIAESVEMASDLVAVKIDLLNHTYDGDLTISLIAPDGSSVILCQNVGSYNDDFVNTEFKMSAVNLLSSASAPYTGLFLPQDPFSNLTGSAQGVWYLKIVDNSLGDQGFLYSWTIKLIGENAIENYAWSSGETGIDYSVISPMPLASTTYTVTVTDLKGCVKSDLIDVTVNIPAIVVISENLGVLISNAISGNQWYEQTLGLLVAENGQNYTPTTDGVYYSIVTDVNGCVETSNTINFIYTSLSNISQSANVTVFPNPNNGIFNIEINSESNQALVLELVNIQGQIVFSKELNVFSKYSESFDFSNLAPGIYTMHLTNDNFNEISKIVIQ